MGCGLWNSVERRHEDGGIAAGQTSALSRLMYTDVFSTFGFAAAGLMISRAAIVRRDTHQTTCVAPVTFPVSRPLVLSSRK